jgi:hypothetical protein
VVDPEERKHYTMRQYVFLREAERAHRELSIEGKLLDGASAAPATAWARSWDTLRRTSEV